MSHLSLRRRESGFTLIEVMVAMFVIATAVAALSQAMSNAYSNLGAMEERLFAELVAHNHMVEGQLSGASRNNQGTDELAGRSWYWQRRTESTDDPKMQRMVVTVAPADAKSAVLVELQGFVGASS